MIFGKKRDPRLVTVLRGGTLRDADHHLLAAWAADCAEHVLHHFERALPATTGRAARSNWRAHGPVARSR